MGRDINPDFLCMSFIHFISYFFFKKIFVFSIHCNYSKHLNVFDISVTFNFLFLCLCHRHPDFQLLQEGERYGWITYLLYIHVNKTLRVNQVIWALGLPVLMHYVSAHSSPHKEIFALYSFFFSDGKMMCLLCMIYCTALSNKKV